MSELNKAMAARIERDLFSALAGVSTSTVAQPQEPLTLDTLHKMMLNLPPRETWLSSRFFPCNRALRIEGSGENFTCAHPGFWMRLESEIRRTGKPATPARNFLGVDLTPIEIDPWADDSPDTAKWRAAHWDRLRDAAMVAMAYADLPEYLKSPPKVGTHG